MSRLKSVALLALLLFVSVSLSVAVVRQILVPTLSSVSANSAMITAALSMLAATADEVLAEQRKTEARASETGEVRAENRRRIVVLERRVTEHELHLRQLVEECR